MDKRVEFAKAVTISNKSHHEKSIDTAAIQETNRQIEHIMQKRSYARRTRQTTMQQALSEEHDVLMQAALRCAMQNNTPMPKLQRKISFLDKCYSFQM